MQSKNKQKNITTMTELEKKLAKGLEEEMLAIFADCDFLDTMSIDEEYDDVIYGSRRYDDEDIVFSIGDYNAWVHGTMDIVYYKNSDNWEAKFSIDEVDYEYASWELPQVVASDDFKRYFMDKYNNKTCDDTKAKIYNFEKR